MQGVNVIARIAKFQAITPPFVQRVHRLHLLHRKRFAVQRPLIESVERRIELDDQHLDRFIRSNGLGIGLAELRVIPMKRLRIGPLGVAFPSGIFDDNTHPVTAVVMVEVAHYPHARVIHVNNGRNSLGRSQPQHGDIRRRRH